MLPAAGWASVAGAAAAAFPPACGFESAACVVVVFAPPLVLGPPSLGGPCVDLVSDASPEVRSLSRSAGRTSAASAASTSLSFSVTSWSASGVYRHASSRGTGSREMSAAHTLRRSEMSVLKVEMAADCADGEGGEGTVAVVGICSK
jgi:hypothetical protein